jgi:membrane protease YdiL (CAAX protease family)
MSSFDIRPIGESPPSEFPPATTASRPRELWTFRDLMLFLAFAAVSIPLSGFFVSIFYLQIHRAMGWRLPPAGIQTSAFLLIALQLIVHALLLGYIYFLIHVQYQRPFWQTLSWRRPSIGQASAYALGGFLLAVLVEFAPTFLPDKTTFPLEKLFSSPQAAYAMSVFAVCVAPFMEELIFRGVLFAFFERFGGLAFAAGLTALLFAALHMSEYSGAWNHLLLILVVGLVFSLARAWSGSLAPSVILHTAYNLTLMLGLYFSTDHFRLLPGPHSH